MENERHQAATVLSMETSNEINISDSNHAIEIDEMELLATQIANKFGGTAEIEGCFPTNPVVPEDSNLLPYQVSSNQIRANSIHWCTCSNCAPMATEIESICCREIQNALPFIDGACIVEHEYFNLFCERSDTLNIVMRAIGQVQFAPSRRHHNRQLRKSAYRTFTTWVHGYLGLGNRRPIPSCVVTKVRNTFPDPENTYIGFKFARELPAEYMALQ